MDEETPVAGLRLYQTEWCSYCVWVRETLDTLGVTLELADTGRNLDFYKELMAARGRTTVPVLRIEHPDGSVEWMPESADIVAYLKARFGEAEVSSPPA